jgi:hypothetical protein
MSRINDSLLGVDGAPSTLDFALAYEPVIPCSGDVPTDDELRSYEPSTSDWEEYAQWCVTNGL